MKSVPDLATAPPPPPERIVAVGVKALNEEKRIDACLRSALAAVAPFGGEVILADSGSTDRTLEIAVRHPVRIVRLSPEEQRCCGAGAQLAFQHSNARYFYILDGDMELSPNFLGTAIARLEAEPDLAGIGGFVEEAVTDSEEFQIRAAALASDANRASERPVACLDCGGLYRSRAIRQLGWFADPNLHSFEEFELGARLRSQGWKLIRTDQQSASHYGHDLPGYNLLRRRLRSRYSDGVGEVLRAAIGRSHLRTVLRDMRHLQAAVVVILWWIAIAAGLFFWAPVVLILLAVPVLFLSIRRKSVRLGLYSLASWNVTAIGLVRGFLAPRRRPNAPLRSDTLVSSPTAHSPKN